MPRIYIDVSETYQNKLETGIQRVVRNATKEMMSLAALRNLDVWLYVSHPSVDKSFVTKDLGILTPPSVGQDTQPLKEKVIQQLAKIYSKLSQGKLALVLESRPVISLSRWVVNRIRSGKTDPSGDLETPGIPDYFLILDSFWSRGSTVSEEIEKMQGVGTRVGLVLYDVIPITHPQFVDDMNAAEFRRCLNSIVTNVNDFFFISESAKEEFLSIYRNLTIRSTKKVIPLGFYPKENLLTKNTQVEAEGNGKKILLLSIGTVEPRKNYQLLLDWWKACDTAKYELTVIGRPGWKNKVLQEQMVAESKKGEGFNWLGHVSEEELQIELSRAQIGIAPSLVEGYGLPLIEMAGAGLKVVASDIPVFREVAPEDTFFFDPMSTESLQAAIDSCASSGARRDVDFSMPWSETAKALLGQIQETEQ